MPSLKSKIEAVLYLKGQPLSIAQIAEFAGCDRAEAEEGLIDLMADYAHRDTALEVVETQDGYCLQLRSVFKHLVTTLIPLDLGVGALRTLAAIALKGPISQTELVELRGSGVYQQVPDLVASGFVRKRRQSDGRSYWLQITNKFYQHFEIDQLPSVTPKKVDNSSDPMSNAVEAGVEAEATAPADLDQPHDGEGTVDAIEKDD
ncbi:MAG: SMC-Scp complex subunit ScpB [Cyanobacteria bacterium J06635_15]